MPAAARYERRVDFKDNRYHSLPRHLLPLPAERAAALPLVFVPPHRIVAPWMRGRGTLADARRLAAVIERVADLDVSVPVWVWEDAARAPVPVAAGNVQHWLMHWCRDRACYAADVR